jgi:hypothetical protein
MPEHTTLSEVAALAAGLSPEERKKLAEAILQELSLEAPGRPQHRRLWRDIRGSMSFHLGGEDAQAWVSRSRRESDEHREPGERNGA